MARLLVVLLVFSLWSADAFGQSKRAVTLLAEPDQTEEPTPLGVSARSFWFGSQLAWAFPDEGAFVENILVNGSVLYFLTDDEDRAIWGIPIIGNLSAISSNNSANEVSSKLAESIRSNQGLQVGVQGYYCFAPNSFFSPTVFATASYKLNAANAIGSGELQYLHQARISVGFEAEIGGTIPTAKSPMSISITPTLALPLNEDAFDAAFGVDRFHSWILEASFILPVANGVGVLLEGYIPLGAGYDRGGRVGLIFSTPQP